MLLCVCICICIITSPKKIGLIGAIYYCSNFRVSMDKYTFKYPKHTFGSKTRLCIMTKEPRGFMHACTVIILLLWRMLGRQVTANREYTRTVQAYQVDSFQYKGVQSYKGKNQVHYNVHKSSILRCSAYMACAWSFSWMESSDHQYRWGHFSIALCGWLLMPCSCNAYNNNSKFCRKMIIYGHAKTRPEPCTLHVQYHWRADHTLYVKGARVSLEFY